MFAVHSVYAGMSSYNLVYVLVCLSTVHYCKITKICEDIYSHHDQDY